MGMIGARKMLKDNVNQMIVMAMDVSGWEQDGSGLTFVNVGGNGKRKTFGSWQEVYDFVLKINGK